MNPATHHPTAREGPSFERPSNSVDILERAVASIGRGRYCDAASELSEAVQAWPEWAPARAYMGLAYLRLGEVDEARHECETAMMIAPTSFICRFVFAEYWARLGYYDRAMEQLDEAVGLTAPSVQSLLAALDFRRYCRDRAKGIYYRRTAFPRLDRLWPFGRRARKPATKLALGG